MKEHQGHLRGDGRRFGIVVARFNELITRPLLAGARDCLVRHGASDDDIEVAWVPGAWEIPSALDRMARGGRFDALIGLGCVIRGATPHFDIVAGQSASGVAAIAAKHELPVINGIITTETIEQAIERAGTKAGNKGWDAAAAAIEMADLFARLDAEAAGA
ncbi:MAG: 6,7-dimethyl-8-ribityllumazine synthase [Gemmatimonadetes bacterium]|nr:6,7-dimethyl-8-ribityllumazine synthase [Gemmatimonadota bacterium]